MSSRWPSSIWVARHGQSDRLTRGGIKALSPGEAGRRRSLGKFHRRPSGGGSGCGVVLRLRSALDAPPARAPDAPVAVR